MSVEKDGYTSEDVAGVLEHFSWKSVASSHGSFEVWADPVSAREVLLPTNADAPDFEGLIRHAVNALVHQYGEHVREILVRSQIALRRSMFTARWRKETPDSSGSIAWDDGQALFNSARAQLAASAKSTVNPKRYHGNSSHYVANEFVKQALMGQTEVGSFIVNAHVPGSAQFYPSEKAAREATSKPHAVFSDLVRVSGSDVMAVFDRSLEILSENLKQIRSGGRVEESLDAVGDGISYELVRAVTEVVAGTGVSIEIDWAPAMKQQKRSTRHEFASEEVTELSRVATFLASTAQPRPVTLVGLVTLLSRDPDTDEQVVRIHAVDGNETRKARVRLDDHQYEIALEAHRSDVPMVVTGMLEKEGQSYWLYNPSTVDLANSSQVRRRSDQGELDISKGTANDEGLA